MIAISQNLPFVKWHGQRQIPLSEGWVLESLCQSAELAGVHNWDICEQVTKAIVYFLQQDFKGSVITVADLQKIMRHSLHGVGYHHVALQAHVVAPRVNIYLPDIARQAPYELIFFNLLKDRLREAMEVVVRGIRLEGLRPCAKILGNAQRWQQRCQELSEEIVLFSRQNLQIEENPSVELVIC